jgi:lipopolysaccharide transport system ATP-binding protein
LICGTLNPTCGSIQTKGRIAALLELGSGFNPEFSGRENVYMNASVMGLSKEEISARFDDILAFADIGNFIEQPVKAYSSGMMVRLAFAVIAHVDADILVIDEALAVGDVFFQQKCMRFILDFQDKKGTVFFVSHDMGSVMSLCNRAILLSNGSVAHTGNAEHISKMYLEQLYAAPERRKVISAPENSTDLAQPFFDDVSNDCKNQISIFKGENSIGTTYVASEFRDHADRFGEGKATIIKAGFRDQEGNNIRAIRGGESVVFFIQVAIHQLIRWPAFGFMIKNLLGEFIFTEGTDAHFRHHELEFHEGDSAVAFFKFVMPHLNKGTYLINVAFAEGQGDEHIQHCWIHDALQLDVISSRLAHGYCGMDSISMSIEVDTMSHTI